MPKPSKEYQVSQVLGVQWDDNNDLRFKIKWKAYAEQTWERYENMSCDEHLGEFFRSIEKKLWSIRTLPPPPQVPSLLPLQADDKAAKKKLPVKKSSTKKTKSNSTTTTEKKEETFQSDVPNPVGTKTKKMKKETAVDCAPMPSSASGQVAPDNAEDELNEARLDGTSFFPDPSESLKVIKKRGIVRERLEAMEYTARAKPPLSKNPGSVDLFETLP